MSALHGAQSKQGMMTADEVRATVFDAKLKTTNVTVRSLGRYVIERQVPYANGVSWMELHHEDDPARKLTTFVCFDALNCRREKGVKLIIDELRSADGVIHKARTAR